MLIIDIVMCSHFLIAFVRTLIAIAIKLSLRTKQADYSNAFVQADIDGEVYCELPKEFSLADGGKSEYVLKLKKSLYGLLSRHRFCGSRRPRRVYWIVVFRRVSRTLTCS